MDSKPRTKIRELVLVPVADPPEWAVRSLDTVLRLAVGLDVDRRESSFDVASAYDSRRGQLDSRRILSGLEQLERRDDQLVLGVTGRDLYSAIFTFVFGEAHLGGAVAVVSFHRLRSELYGLPIDPLRLRGRLAKEALHEVGHLFGLVHCHAPSCVMGFSGVVEEIDSKAIDYCELCLAKIARVRMGTGACTLAEGTDRC
jgi:archaemetzincin